MELINSVDELNGKIQNCEGCIICGAGTVGAALIQYLNSESMSSKVICFAVMSRKNNPGNLMGIPVCTYDEVSVYKEKYTFVIAAMEHKHKSINTSLKSAGINDAYAIGNSLYTSIRKTTNDFSVDIITELRQEMRIIKEHVKELKYLVEEQNEIDYVNSKAFSEYENCFLGKRVAIIGAGPTLNKYKPIDNVINIGVNTVYRRSDIPFDFIFLQDGRKKFLENKFYDIDTVRCRIFMGRVLKRFNLDYSEFPETWRLSYNVTNFIFDHNWPDLRMYRDIAHHPLSGGETVTFSALHFALYTHPEKIYLVGCDSTREPHYDGTGGADHYLIPEVLTKKYKIFKEFAELHYPDTEIISINPVGLKGIFKDIYM